VNGIRRNPTVVAMPFTPRSAEQAGTFRHLREVRQARDAFIKISSAFIPFLFLRVAVPLSSTREERRSIALHAASKPYRGLALAGAWRD
jgi:hypothetical protein